MGVAFLTEAAPGSESMGSRCASAWCETNAMQSRHCPRNGESPSFNQGVDESDTSLKSGAMALFVHDVAEGNIGGNPCRCRACSHYLIFRFPSLIPIQD